MHQDGDLGLNDDADLDARDEMDPLQLAVWTHGWQEKVYADDSDPPDITLGELLLLYFEWMSVHKVRCVRAVFGETVWA